MSVGVNQLTEQQAEALVQAQATELGPTSSTISDTVSVSTITDELAALKMGLAEISESLATGVGRLATAPVPTISPSFDPSKLTIVNKIPSTVISVLKQQFRLMNKWMQPIHEATQDQRTEMFELRGQLEECIDLYRKLIQRIDK